MWIDPSGYAKRTAFRVNNPNAGNANYTGNLPTNSWSLAQDLAGAHLFETSNIKNRPDFDIFNKSNTPTYYTIGNKANAGQAHLRLYDDTREQGIALTGGNPNMSDVDLVANFIKAYSSESLKGIEGAVRTGNGSIQVAGSNVTPKEAILANIVYGMDNSSDFKALMQSTDMQNLIKNDPELNKIISEYVDGNKISKQSENNKSTNSCTGKGV